MMNLLNETHRKQIAEFIALESERITYNNDIFQILEGNVRTVLQKRMVEDLGEKSCAAAITRVAPINVFKKIVSKLTSIYNQPVSRTVENGNAQDESLLRWYEQTLNMNSKMGKNNQFFNAYQYSLLQIALTSVNPTSRVGKPFIRSVPNNGFLVMSCSEVDPTSPDVIILFMDDVQDGKAKRKCFHVHTDYQFIIMDDKGAIIDSEMIRHQQDGINPYGTTPFVYTNGSEQLAMPMIQTDNREMAVLIPLLLTDLNYAVKFQSFSMFVGIDLADEKVEISPNSVLHLKSDGNGQTPSFNVIKPTVDISETLSLASSQMSLWLTSKGIRPGAVGQLGADQFSSGVSKMIDESDTYESVKEQIALYEQTEQKFWDKLLKRIHPFWVAGGRVENTTLFSSGASIKVTYSQPKPLQSRGELIKELSAEVDAGFTTVETAVRRLNPDMDQKEIEALIQQATDEFAARRPQVAPRQPLQLAN